jgi:hypothetical protein
MKKIKISIAPHDKTKKIFGYAVCRQWADNPNNVDVYEYADSEQEAKDLIRQQKKDERFLWFVAVYQ